jgi:hypothetical protein
VYCSYIGGTDLDENYSLLSLSANRIVIAGRTRSVNFPVSANAFDTTLSCALGNGYVSILQIPVPLLYSTYLGGTGGEWVSNVCVDSEGNIVATGLTSSGDFPVSHDGIDTSLNGASDVFIATLSPSLDQLHYGTYLGGAEQEFSYSMLLLSLDSLWVGGETYSSDFPVTPDAFQPTRPGLISNFLSCISIGSGATVTQRSNSIPTTIKLAAYPNPFNSATNLLFTLSTRRYVTLRIFDVQGRLVRAYPWGFTVAGEHRVIIDGTGLASGMYWIRLESGAVASETKVILLK